MTVTPTVDGDVLAVLAGHDGIFTTGRLHRLLARHSQEGIRKVLRRLTKQGVVESDRVGNAFAYRLNRDHLAAEYIIGLARMQKTLLETHRRSAGVLAGPAGLRRGLRLGGTWRDDGGQRP
ncbi:BlaI/MecI/CopY family transcriptional regulator [Amycolatopsis keratiniphila]|uniref:BlaI/MecI/CopY family transcriptional regulator n=1 Tax=Amycolatopsis keratiniphila TaxID=129921 RepID=UPI000A4637C3|nr:BlaI/MecI/CopY family transcriptional regulator [Amycolatopsis keratiniphila]